MPVVHEVRGALVSDSKKAKANQSDRAAKRLTAETWT